MKHAFLGAAAAGLFAMTAIQTSADAQSSRFDFAFQLNGLGGSGKPTNDILGFGVNGRFRLNERWRFGFGIDRFDEFDVERPALFVGLPADFSGGEIDAKGTSTLVSAWIERVYGRDGRLRWFWAVGGGLNFVDIDAVSGPLLGGGTYRLRIDPGDEIILGLRAGLRVRFAGRFALELVARGDQHLADWQVRDQVSGASATIDDYFVRGVTLGLRIRF